MENFKIYKKHLLIFIISFIIFTPIGTVFHEFGHILVSKSIGYKTTLHFASMEWNNDFKDDILKTYFQYQNEIDNNLSFKGEELYNEKIKKLNYDDLLISIGGVLQTILFGTLALIILLKKYKPKNQNLTFRSWVLVFISLFWLRELFNLIKGFYTGIFNKNSSFFWGDEARISKLLEIHSGTLSLSLGMISIVIIYLIVFKIIPYKLRFTFIISGFIGSFIGIFLWTILIGPKILP